MRFWASQDHPPTFILHILPEHIPAKLNNAKYSLAIKKSRRVAFAQKIKHTSLITTAIYGLGYIFLARNSFASIFFSEIFLEMFVICNWWRFVKQKTLNTCENRWESVKYLRFISTPQKALICKFYRNFNRAPYPPKGLTPHQ